MFRTLFYFLAIFFFTCSCYAAELAVVHNYVRHVVTNKEFDDLYLHDITVQDPFYNKEKHYQAYRLPDILKLVGIAVDWDTIWVFTAGDGSKISFNVSEALENSAHAFLAIKDLDKPQGWKKFQKGKESILPGPYYLIWKTSKYMPKDVTLPWISQVTEISVERIVEKAPKIKVEKAKEVEKAPAKVLPVNIVKIHKNDLGWELLLNGKPYLIHGMCYYPTTIGESPNFNTRRNWEMVDDNHDGRNDFGYKTWTWNKHIEVGDFKLMQNMGVNTIRVYQHVSDEPKLKALNMSDSNDLNYPPEKEKKVLRELYSKFGIMTAMGDLLGAYTANTGASWEAGTDYTDPKQRANMLLSVKDMVEQHKDEPYVLMWILGNENDLPYAHTNAVRQPEAYVELVNEAAALIKKIDKGRHPVAVCNGSETLLPYYAKYAPDVDIFGLNMYQAGGFHRMWEEIVRAWDRPVVLTEFGTGYPLVQNGKLNENLQTLIHRQSWDDIFTHTVGHGQPAVAIGGFIFEWVDNWWQDGDPSHQNVNPDGSGWNHEYNGMCSMGDGTQGSLKRHLRKVYWMYEHLWKNE